MTTNVSLPKQISLDQAKAYLDSLDLNYIVDSMCGSEYPLPQWTHSDAMHCLHLYKNFLYLHKKHSSQFLVPTKEIDEFWHNHILHTKKYIHDCLNIFGHYLHHDPASPNDSMDELAANYLKTKELYKAEFNQDFI